MATVFYASTSELATLSNTFTVDGVETDPSTVTLTVTTPSQTSTDYVYGSSSMTRTGAGAFALDVTCSEAGEWTYRWVGTGSDTDTVVGTWTVWETALGKLYATVEALKSRVGITDDTDDAELLAACFTASRSVEQFCQRTFWRTASGTVRVFEPTGYHDLDFGPWNDLVALTGLATDESGAGTWGTAWAGTDYQLVPLNPSAGPEQRPYTGLRTTGSRLFPALSGYGRTDRIQITGTWGWPAVPQAIRQAALIVAAELFKAKDAPLGVVGFGDLGVVRLRENPLAARLAGPYRLAPVGVA